MKNLGFGVLVVLLAFPVLAEEQDDAVTLTYAAELLLGMAKHETQLDERTTWNRVFESDNQVNSTGLRGVAKLTEGFAFELAYHLYGDNDEEFRIGNTMVSQSISTSAINVGIKISSVFTDISAYLRTGVSYWRVNADVDLSALANDVGSADNGRNFYHGLGVQYQFLSNYSIAADYTVTSMDVAIGGFAEAKHKVQNLSLALGYHF